MLALFALLAAPLAGPARGAEAPATSAAEVGPAQRAMVPTVAAADASTQPQGLAFDALFKRLDFGDLSEVDTERELAALRDLDRDVPAGDAHRRRLAASMHCLIDYPNANEKGHAFAEKQLTEALAANDQAAAIRFYYCRGSYQDYLSVGSDGLADVNRGIDLARAIDDEALLAQGLETRGGKFSWIGAHGKALADLLEAQRLFNKNGLTLAANHTLQSIGIAYRRLGYPDKAREYLSQGQARARTVGDRDSDFTATLQLGFLQQDTGHPAQALALHTAARDVAVKIGDRSYVGAAEMAMASDANDLGRHTEAQALLDKADAEMKAGDDAADRGMLAFERGRALAGMEQHVAALDEFRLAQDEFAKAGNTRYQESLFLAVAGSLEAEGQSAAALQAFKRYLDKHDEVQKQRADQQAQMLRAQFDTDRANLENARLLGEQASQNHQMDSLVRARRWQRTALSLLAALLVLLAVFAISQIGRLRRWREMASTDALTGIANRRRTEHFLASAMRHARTHDGQLSVLALDIDDFKRINDIYGHAGGDRVLQQIADTCRKALRRTDLFGRIGGEEFLGVLPGSSLAHAQEKAERIRMDVEALALKDVPPGARATISIGVAELDAYDVRSTDLVGRADAALYLAKTGGRNRVVCT